MISLRQHAISIVAIFLALALGVVLGSQTLAADLLGGLRSDKAELRVQLDAATEQNRQLTEQLGTADQFLVKSAGAVVQGTLAERTVLIFTTPDAAPEDVDKVSRNLEAAGAAITGRIALNAPFLDTGEGDRLRSALINVLPAGAQLRTGATDQGSIAGDLLGQVLLLDPATAQPRSTPEEFGLVLETLRGGGFLAYGDDPVRAGQLAVVITGDMPDAADGSRGATLARFAGGLRAASAGVVLAGRPGAVNGQGPIDVVRSDTSLAARVTTVDNIDGEIGRVTAVLGLGEQLNGGAGRYGTGAKATALTLEAPTS
ncbi:copper transporter [Nocardia sp. NPDC057353]|uniref:copper transporter n=1 Tax=Nocardia sp. NPDC057353 TaxID=3346104 RepID=UPI00362985CB